MKKTYLLIAFAVLLGAQSPQQKADLVLRNGRIYTMDAARSWAEAVAIRDGKIVYIGTDAGVSGWLSKNTMTIDLTGHFVMPGFTDAHVHPISAGVELGQLNLAERETKEQILSAVKEYAAAHPELEWIIGGSWQLPIFPDANPQKEWLDEIIPDRPVLLTAADGHSTWVNSKALELAGITKDTPNPTNGRIERNQEGEPSGTLRESASDLVYKVAPEPSAEERLKGLQTALATMNRFGITGFTEASASEEYLQTYQEAEKKGLLTAYVTVAMYSDPEGSMEKILDQIQNLKKWREQYAGNYVRPTAVKIFADGVIEARTAALLQPYLDAANEAGDLNWSPEKLDRFIDSLDREKFQIHIHAIGDRGIRASLSALESAQRKNGYRDGRPILSHIQLIDPADIPGFAAIHAIPCFQPLWAYEDTYITDLTIPKLGKERSRWIYPIGSVNKTGAVIAFGSDWSVSSVNPLDGIEVAVTRKDPEGKNGKDTFIPEERMSLPAALAAYTIGSAYGSFLDKETGSIEKGKSANIIVLSNNLFEIEPEQINETNVLLTLFEGKTVYKDPMWKEGGGNTEKE